MKVVFVSNYINHHQLPVSTRLLERCRENGGDYTFVQTEPMEEERVNMGWSDTLKVPDFVKNYWEEQALCDQLIMEADAVIFGGLEREEIIRPRLLNNLPVWRYSESVYKTGRYKFVSPRGLRKKFHDHTAFAGKRVYLLCAGAYVAGDFRCFGAYPGKKYRYGYFPKCRRYEEQEWIGYKQKQGPPEILWAARMIDWKHPETAIEIARDLKRAGVGFRLRMLGDGEKMPMVRELVETYGLSEEVILPGFCNPEETRGYMEKADIYLATSDRREGWGAVVNEAMNSGCVVLANRGMGSAPYLIEDGKSGLLYDGKHREDLYKKLLPYLTDAQKRLEMGKCAYERIRNLWNAETAADRLYDMMRAEKDGRPMPIYTEGPLSKLKF